MNQPLTQSKDVAPSDCDWMQDRLTEARGILLEAPRHRNTLVILAARVIARQTDNADECIGAIDLLRQPDGSPSHAVAAVPISNGGAA
jgi:hypothetical protein